MDLRRHPCFESWRDPQSGVESFVLRERVAPVQQSFYFTNTPLTADEQWLWFYTAFPPGPARSLGVVALDPARPVIRHFPHAQFSAESPAVIGDSVCYCARDSIWQLDRDGGCRRLFTLPADYVAGRELRRLATHLTVSADGRYFLLDGEVGNHWFVGLADRRTGEFTLIKEFAHHFNHAQFSPVDPALFTIAMDHFRDRVTGRRFHYDKRVWLMDIHNTRFDCLTPDDYAKHLTGICHEWWSRDGRVCWVDYERGVYECDPVTRETVCVWPGAACHAHCDPTRRYWCADESPYRWDERPCEVRWFDRQTGRQQSIVSAMPAPPVERAWYHIDPHPQFSPRGTAVIYTTVVADGVTVALAPCDPLR